jgi:hypothetical protein
MSSVVMHESKSNPSQSMPMHQLPERENRGKKRKEEAMYMKKNRQLEGRVQIPHQEKDNSRVS